MKRARAVPRHLAVLLASCAGAATLGVLALADDAARSAARYRERADAALAAGREALAAAATSLRDGLPGALAFVGGTDGSLIEPQPARPTTASAPTSAPAPGDAGLLALVRAEVDALERASGSEAAATRLRALLADATDAAVVPWALTALAALEARAGRPEAAAAARRRLIDEFPNARDDRGLRRAFAARMQSAEDAGSPLDALLALYDDVVADLADPPQPAVPAFLARVAEAAEAAARREGAPADAAARLAAVAAKDRARARTLRFAAAWREGVAQWVASGADGGLRAFPRDDGPPFVVTVGPAKEERVAGFALEADALARLAFGRPEVATFAAVGLVLGFDAEKDVLARGPAREPWAPATLTVVGADLEAFRRSDRRRFLLGAGLAAAALVVAAVAARAAVRAVNRELAFARDREQFVAAVTHELKTPLAAVKLLGELLADEALDPPRRREFAGRVVSEADRLARLVASVLDLARLEHADPTEARKGFRTLDLAATAREAADAFRPLAARAGGDVVVVADEGPLRISGDADLLRGALLNLLDNAVKYADGPQVVEVEARRAGPGRVVVAVSDRGRGVPPAERERIFRPFTRVGNELLRDRPGAGLGLALVARAAALHGGEATCAARTGGGSRFEISLPALDVAGAAPEDGRA